MDVKAGLLINDLASTVLWKINYHSRADVLIKNGEKYALFHDYI